MIQQLTRPSSPRMNGIGLKVGIIVARYNLYSINAMFSRAYELLKLYGVAPEDIRVISVPGPDELAHVAQTLLTGDFYNAIICLGYVPKNTTRYSMLLEDSSPQGFQWVALCAGVPVIFGLTSAEDAQHADQRIKRAANCARIAVQMGRAAIAGTSS